MKHLLTFERPEGWLPRPVPTGDIDEHVWVVFDMALYNRYDNVRLVSGRSEDVIQRRKHALLDVLQAICPYEGGLLRHPNWTEALEQAEREWPSYVELAAEWEALVRVSRDAEERRRIIKLVR